MKKMIIVGAILTASAFAVTCEDLQRIEKETGEFYKEYPYKSNDLELKWEQLRLTLKKNGYEGDISVDDMNHKQLDQAAEVAGFSIYELAGEKFQGINVGAGDNPFIYLFKMNTLEFADIMSLDGTLYINNNYCKVDGEL